MNPKKVFTINTAVSKIKYIQNGEIIVIDEENSVRKFDLEKLKLSGGFKIKLPKNRVYGNNIDVSKNGDFMGLGVKDTSKALLWNLETKKPSFTLGWHKGEIEAVEFDKQGHYVGTGGVDGRSYVWSIKTGKMVGTLAPHADYVTSIGFSKNGYWVATGSYDKTISVTNLSSMQFAFKLRGHKGAVFKIKFLDNFKLISGDKQGEMILWDYSKGKVLHRLPNLTNQVIDFIPDGDEKYLFAVPKGKNVFLYDLETKDIITNSYIKLNSSITCLEFVPELNYLIIGTADGIIYIYDILSDEKELKEHINSKHYDKAYELIFSNPLLHKSETYKELEQIWDDTLEKCYKLLEKSQIDAVKQIFEPFMVVPSKRMLIQAILKDFAEFDKFKMLIVKKKYPLAYSLANKHKSFKDTVYYKHMEKEWKKTFLQARTLIFDKSKEEMVKQLLKPFRGVPEKTPLIQSLFSEKEIYKLLKLKFQKKEFSDFFSLIDRYPFLIDLDEYKNAMTYGEKLYNQAQTLLKDGQYNKVMNYVKVLEDFPNYKDDIKELEKKSTLIANLISLIASKDYDKVYQLVKEIPFLEDIHDFEKLEETWQKKVYEAEELVSTGEAKHILQSLNYYMNIEEKRPKILELIKSAYLNQILDLLKSRSFTEEILTEGIKSYITIFGFDLEISDLIEISKKAGVNIDLSNIKEGNREDWYKRKLPNSIFE
jgi:hypothetical protein